MSQHSHRSSLLAALGLFVSLSACGSDDNDTTASASPATNPAGDGGAGAPAGKDPLVILTERTGPDTALHYLNVLPDWPADGKIDFAKSVEMGEPGVAHVEGDALYFYRAKEGVIEKLGIDPLLQVQRAPSNRISFQNWGIKGFDAEPIYVSDKEAFLLDEKSGQIARFNPAELKIDSVSPLDPAVLKRDGLDVQFQLGLAANGRLFTTTNWRDWKGKVVPATVIGVFDQQNPAGGPKLVEEPRCAPSVAAGVFQDADYVYAVSDAANAFDVLASPVRTTLLQCVVRMRKDGNAFEPDYLIDLQKVTGSPAIRMTWPMKDHKLLVQLWSPSISTASIVPGMDKTFWEATGWSFAIVDLVARTSTPIAAIQPGPSRSPKLLQVDEQNYLQFFRADESSIVYRVNSDATVTQVLDLPKATNLQYIARLKPAAKK